MTDTRCGATTRKGTPCRRYPLEGEERCRDHGDAGTPREVTLPGGDTVRLADDVGRVRVHDGVAHLDGLGLALRLGLGGPADPEMAAALFPAFELLDGEERPKAGEVFQGVPVFAWVTQDHAAVLVKLSRRQLQNLESKGAPTRGHRTTKRYPLPHLLIWHRAYVGRGGPEGKVPALPFRVAQAWNGVQHARLELQAAEGLL